ncbi:MAG: hypothetical protein Q7R95_06480 [bacterium]|nr:hypothetical protein [bacterium]
MNKRGQELSTNTIIIIILAVIVLVILVLGFTLGWSKIIPWIPSNNVNTIVTSCDAACATGDKYGFCSAGKELNDGSIKVVSNCATFSVFSAYATYGIKSCNTINCDFTCSDIKIKETAAEEKDACVAGEEDISSIAKVATGKKCCILTPLK